MLVQKNWSRVKRERLVLGVLCFGLSSLLFSWATEMWWVSSRSMEMSSWSLPRGSKSCIQSWIKTCCCLPIILFEFIDGSNHLFIDIAGFLSMYLYGDLVNCFPPYFFPFLQFSRICFFFLVFVQHLKCSAVLILMICLWNDLISELILNWTPHDLWELQSGKA